MTYGWDQPRLFDGDGWGRRPPPGLKSFLFILNLQIDWILSKIQVIQQSYDPIIFPSGKTEIENLTILLEDRQYFNHSGIDFRAIPRVIRQALTFKRVGDVSTIEQQLVRTLIERRERTLRRKFREILLSYILSHRLSKREILRTYLSTAYLGYKLRGVDQACIFLFQKNSTNLSVGEAALIASFLVYPMPKSIYLATLQKREAVLDINLYLNEMGNVATRWSRRVTRRMSYGISLRSKSK
jgi:membrane peptidoglycan carboxypeptidase